LADEIKMQFGDKVSEIITKPSDNSGTFDVFLGEDLIFSKLKQTFRLPQPGEVEQILIERLMK
jgi:predicted Rdx family selenoprotein